MDAVQMRGIYKRFGSLVASNRVNFDLKVGEIHALLGENGAGKTTLMRILYGLYHADEGEIILNGLPAHITSPKDAIRLGIGMVTQHFTLVPTLTVAENLVLGQHGKFILNPKAIEKEIAGASERFGIQVNPGALVRHLSVGERQRVEILKALYRNARVLILDEPTAVLVPQEVVGLFEALERLRKTGLSVIFISHKLNEVMAVSDRISVLRDGTKISTVEKVETSQSSLAQMMVGREYIGISRQEEKERGDAFLEVQELCALDKKGMVALKGISFEVHSGEILGIAGVSGNGQTELSQVLTGMIKPSGGRVVVKGKDLTGAAPQEMTANSVGRIPEDRHSSLVGELSVAENLALEQIRDFSRNGVLDRHKIRENAEKQITEFQIKATSDIRVRTLSGGNMQKVLLARAFCRQPEVVIASQPTRGLDVGATEYVRKKLLEQRDRGAAVLLLSEDLDEIMALADRIAVIYEGRIMGTLQTREASIDKLGLMMSGTNGIKVDLIREADHV